MLVTSVILALGEVDVRESGVQNHLSHITSSRLHLATHTPNQNKLQQKAVFPCIKTTEKEAVSEKFPSPIISQV